MRDPLIAAISGLHAAVDDRVRDAYNLGFTAGEKHAEFDAGQTYYRRGYEAGYAAKRAGRPAKPKPRQPRMNVGVLMDAEVID